MKKIFYSAIIGAGLLINSAHADTNENAEFCNQLRTVSTSIVKVGVDAYSIEHHKDVGVCENISPDEWKQMLAESSMFGFLLGLESSFSQQDREHALCMNLAYNVFVTSAIKKGIDTIDGMKDLTQKENHEMTNLFKSCGEFVKTLGKQGV